VGEEKIVNRVKATLKACSNAGFFLHILAGISKSMGLAIALSGSIVLNTFANNPTGDKKFG
jgi:hypothetical protein